MEHKSSLFLIGKNTSDAEILAVAETAYEQQAHLTCLMLDLAPALPYYAYGSTAYGSMAIPDDWSERVKKSHTEIKARAEEAGGLLARAGATGEVQPVINAGIDIKHSVSQRARTCDIAHIAPSLRDNETIFAEAAHGVLFHSPVGLMLNGDPLIRRDRIFVAWDGGQAAASAVHAALPYLRAAEEVVIGCFDLAAKTGHKGEDPGAGLAAWLSHHRCPVTLAQYPSGGAEIGRCILERAREAGAGMVVMGAYGHSRWREAVFGGTTRAMMEQTGLPVLLAH